jgi:4-hydroxy-tetrahydrodipicolinate synthase
MTDIGSSGLRSLLHGLWLPLITPFRDGVLDEASLRRLLRHYAALPVNGLIIAATSGEGLTLGMAELEWIVELARSEIASPYYSRPSQRGLTQHFSALADHAAWPIVLYNIPYRTAVNLANETLLELAEHPNIVGLKDCCADRAQSIDLLRRRPAGFRVLTGEDALYYEALSDGADGGILLSAHIETATFAAAGALLRQGDPDAARARWESVSDLTRLLFAEPSPAAAKYGLWRTGLIDSAEVRLPMVEVSSELAARLDAEIERRLRSHQHCDGANDPDIEPDQHQAC